MKVPVNVLRMVLPHGDEPLERQQGHRRNVRDTMTEKPQIAIIHPQLREGGGSEARALRAAEALEGDYDVILITMGCPYLGRLNRNYGTHLSADRIRVVHDRRSRFPDRLKIGSVLGLRCLALFACGLAASSLAGFGVWGQGS